MSKYESIASRAIESATALEVRSALNPALWLCGIVTIPCLFISLFLSSPPTWLIVLICTPVAIASFGFMFLLVMDRDRLQSESFQLRKQELEMIEQKGDSGPKEISSVEFVSNTAIPSFSSSELK